MKKTIAKQEKKSKRNSCESILSVVSGLGLEDLDAKVAVIQALIPLGLAAVSEQIEKEVRALAGKRHQRVGRLPGYVRWAKQNGSVYLGDQKVPIRYTRVRNLRDNAELSLCTCRKFQEPREMEEGVLRRVLLGLSCGRYGEAAEAVPEAFGLFRSSLSRRFMAASGRKLNRYLPGILSLIQGAQWLQERNWTPLGPSSQSFDPSPISPAFTSRSSRFSLAARRRSLVLQSCGSSIAALVPVNKYRQPSPIASDDQPWPSNRSALLRSPCLDEEWSLQTDELES